jgi:hypothetical protein
VKRLSAPGSRSLTWAENSLVDWVGGGRKLFLDGTIGERAVRYGYRFDAAIACENYAVIYERLGTKGLMLENGKILREINRSYYQADVYEYPIALFKGPDGRTVIAHCPEEYNRIELEDVRTGKRLTNSAGRDPSDFFHSRLRASSDGSLLLSAGWVWHPWNDCAVFDVEAAMLDSSTLDRSMPMPKIDFEIVAAEFVSNDRLLIATSGESLGGETEENASGPNKLLVIDVRTAAILSSVPVSELMGSLMPIDEQVTIGFHTYPKLVSLKTGDVLKRWKTVKSGNQMSSIVFNDVDIPPIAIDPSHRRFAVADEHGVWVVHIDDPEF